MDSISFPNIFSSVKTNTVSDHEATAQNLKLLLLTERGSLFGDPYFGTALRKLLYNQNGIILQDLVIDEIYTSITTFMPQIKLSRNNIKLKSVDDQIYATISCINLIDYQTDLYEIKLTSSSEEE